MKLKHPIKLSIYDLEIVVVVVCLVYVGVAWWWSWQGGIRLAWNASPSAGVVGYRIYYGEGNFDRVLNVGNVTTATVEYLHVGHVYFFTVAAYDRAGIESEHRESVSGVAKHRKR